MKFDGNISRDLGIDYHSFSEVFKDGKIIERYTLSEKATPEVEKILSKYDNIKLVKNGASYRYAPEIKYDVIYISIDSESESFESFEEEHLGMVIENTPEINTLLDNEINSLNEVKVDQFARLTEAINMANSLALYYKQLQVECPENSEIFSKMSSEIIEQTNKLQGLINFNQEVSTTSILAIASEDMKTGITEDDPRMLQFRKIILDKIKNHPDLSEEESQDFINELEFEDIGEMVGFYDEEGPDIDETLSSVSNMEKAADDYISAVMVNFKE